MLTILVVLVLLYAWWAPASPLGAWVHEQAARAVLGLSRQRPLTIVLLALFLAGLAGLVAYAETEGLMIAAPAAAEGLAWFAAMDVGTYVEVFAVAWLLRGTTRLRIVIRALRAAPARIAHRLAGARRSWRRPRPRRPPAPREDPEPIWLRSALAAA